MKIGNILTIKKRSFSGDIKKGDKFQIVVKHETSNYGDIFELKHLKTSEIHYYTIGLINIEFESIKEKRSRIIDDVINNKSKKLSKIQKELISFCICILLFFIWVFTIRAILI